MLAQLVTPRPAPRQPVYPLPWNTTSTPAAATNAEYFYDYAGQDPINGYDLSGQAGNPMMMMPNRCKHGCKYYEGSISLQDLVTGTGWLAFVGDGSCAFGFVIGCGVGLVSGGLSALGSVAVALRSPTRSNKEEAVINVLLLGTSSGVSAVAKRFGKESLAREFNFLLDELGLGLHHHH